MRQYERSGVTVDQCSDCRGIFLDRGELERVVDAENAYNAAPPPGPPVRQQQQYGSRPAAGYRDYDSDEYPQYGNRGGHPRKRRSFLGELFD